ncbi:MAG: septum formation initiator family protein [Spirochaetaceae bacterium]|nr:MAG: septum formation initiator family protein [Spirochaetaceae bacterium]
MKIPRIVVYILLSFVLTSSLFLLFGGGGVLDYRRLLIYRGSVEENITDLERINSELLAEVQALGSDPERLTLQARELGYFREGERVIRIAGNRRVNSYYTIGKVLRRKPKVPRADWPFRATGLGLPILFVLVSMAVRRRKNRETGNQ